MFKTFKYRLYPTNKQQVLIDKHINCCRFIYNLSLETKIRAYECNRISLSSFDLQKQLPELKVEYVWLKEVNAQSLCKSIDNMDAAFSNFFKGRHGFPKFKKKGVGQSFTVPQAIRLVGDKICIPKFKEGIPIVLHRKIAGNIKRAVLSKTPTSKYFVSILIDDGEDLPEKVVINVKKSIGIDLGIKTFLVTSDGQYIDNPKFLKRKIGRLKYIQRKCSKHNGSKNKKKLALLYERVCNQRRDFLQKTSRMLINNHDSVCIENLFVSGMIRNHSLAQSISDCGWASFVEMLKYKANRTGKNVLQISRFEPTSKTCSNCGCVNMELTLHDREWACCGCGILHDRDLNAAINIRNIALFKKLVYGT